MAVGLGRFHSPGAISRTERFRARRRTVLESSEKTHGLKLRQIANQPNEGARAAFRPGGSAQGIMDSVQQITGLQPPPTRTPPSFQTPDRALRNPPQQGGGGLFGGLRGIAGDVGGIARDVGGAVADVATSGPARAVGRGLARAEDFLFFDPETERGFTTAAVEKGLELEQSQIAKRTTPKFQAAISASLQAIGVPEDTAGKVGSVAGTVAGQIALPSSLVPFVGKGTKAVRVLRAVTLGAGLSVAQETAFIREFEGRDPELFELLFAAAAGGAGAGVIESGAIGAGVRAVRRGAQAVAETPAVRRGAEIAAGEAGGGRVPGEPPRLTPGQEAVEGPFPGLPGEVPKTEEAFGIGESLETVIRRWDDERGHWRAWLLGTDGPLTRIGRDPSPQQLENILKRSPLQQLRPELALDTGSRRLFAEELANSLTTRRPVSAAPDVVPSRLTPGQEAVPPGGVPPREPPPTGGAPPPRKPPVQALRDAIDQSKKLTKEQQALRTEELKQRAQQVNRELRSDLPPGERLARARARQAGKLPSLGLEPLTNQLDEATILDLHGMIDATFRPFKRRDFDYANTMEALRNLIYDGTLPRPFERKLLQEVFGPDVMISLQRKEGVKLLDELQALINVPRVLLTVFDHSMVLRQDAITAINPRWTQATKESFEQSIRALKRANAEEIELVMRQTPEFVVAAEHKVDFATLRGGSFTAVEEPFIGAAEQTYVGRFIRKWVPGINISEQLATVYLNQKRMKLFTRMANELEQGGGNVTDDLLDEVGEMVNVLTGRATLPSAVQPYVPLLNSIFFSAKMNLSRIKTPGIIARAVLGGEKRTVGLMMAREFATYIATGATVLGALKASGLAEVELDPRSTDFGKAKVGNTRLDFWGGFQPMVRFIAQAAKGERKTALGEVVPADIKELTWRFLRSKFSPQFGTVVNVFEGENIIGEPVTTKGSDLKRVAFETFTPLFVQDVVDAVREMGLLGIPIAAPGVLGVNVQSYTNPSVQKAQAIQEGITDGTIQGEYRVEGEPYIPVRFGELNADDQNRMAERNPEFFSEEAFAERPSATEGIPEFQQRAIRGETIGQAQDTKAQRLSAIAADAGVGDRSNQQLRRNLTESIKDSLSDYGAVLGQAFEQFQFEGDEETFSRQQELATRYRQLSEQHNARFTISDPELRDAAWAQFEEAVAREFTSSDLDTLDRARVANDSEVERVWHELNSQLGSYYELPEGDERTNFRRANPKVDGILWALGRVSRVVSSAAVTEATRAFGQLYGTSIESADVSRGEAGISFGGRRGRRRSRRSRRRR